MTAGSLTGQSTAFLSTQTDSSSPAVEGVLNTFQHFPLVGIEDWHGLAQEEDFYAQLLRNPRFCKEVGNVVVEFGGAAQQTTINRYLSGEDIPYEKLREVWTDTLGWLPTVTSVGYLNVFAVIRAANRGLPSDQQIHVWLGEPPVDWSRIKTFQDLPQLTQRDQYPADIIRTEILAKHKRLWSSTEPYTSIQ